MNKKFIIGVGDLTNDQKEKLQDFIKESKSGWWHHLDHVWLLSAMPDKLTVAKIRDFLLVAAPGVHVLVLEVSPITWATFGPETDNNSFSMWIRKYWK